MTTKHCRAAVVGTANAAGIDFAGCELGTHSTVSNPDTGVIGPVRAERPQTYQRDDLRNLPPALDRLISLPNWVCWKWRWKQPKGGKDGKWDKPPYMSESPGMMAETNRRSTWSSHEHACTAFERGHVTGIGFVLFDTDICAFDIDNCRDPATGEIDPVAMALMNRANSYTEVTVSGTGLRIIGTGSDRYMNRKQKIDGSKVSIESYRNCERYITISGMV